ncbi:MAG TPA: serine/threonine-protein kinase, partial [Gemmatimonadaceae bacterium]|nr:serine/threonine-protein kinase [Gemmatimonadaceae bacterium]
HRDVKAENILIDHTTGRATMTDFGIARLAEAAPITSTGQMLGTVYYASPEQVAGDRVDARSDIYSLGVVGYLALAGRFPFDAELASAVLIAHVNKSPPPLLAAAPATPRLLAAIIDQCLLKDPAARFQRCDDLQDALSAALASAPPAPANASSSNAATPARVSDVEAQAIWERAADLQAMTGIRPRPLPISRPRDAAKDASRTSGYQLSDVRGAALEAGIGGKYVEHAFAEHGLPSAMPSQPPPVAAVDKSRGPIALTGGPTQLEFEIVLDGEMPADDFDLLAEIARHAIGDPGSVSEIGRAFAWHSSPTRASIHVSVRPRSGKTTVRVSEDIQAWPIALFVSVSGIALVGLIPALHGLALGGAPFLGAVGMRGFFGVLSRRRQRMLRQLCETLAAQARDSIAAATAVRPALPRRGDD